MHPDPIIRAHYTNPVLDGHREMGPDMGRNAKNIDDVIRFVKKLRHKEPGGRLFGPRLKKLRYVPPIKKPRYVLAPSFAAGQRFGIFQLLADPFTE